MTTWLRWQVGSRNPSVPPLDVDAVNWALPTINEAATELITALYDLNDHVGGQIAGAAALAGAALRDTSDVDAAGIHLFQFLELAAGDVGWSGYRPWSPHVPPWLEPSYDVPTLLAKLQPLFTSVCADYPLRPPFQPYVAALAALRLVAWAREQGMIEQSAGRELIARYVVAGSRAVPQPGVQALEPEPAPPTGPDDAPAAPTGPIAIPNDERALLNERLPRRSYPAALALTRQALYLIELNRWSFKNAWYVRRIPLDLVTRVAVRRTHRALLAGLSALLTLFGVSMTALMLLPSSDGQPGTLSVLPLVAIAAGLLLPFVSRGHRTMRIDFARRKPYVWKPPLFMSSTTRRQVAMLATRITEAFRGVGIEVRGD